MMIMTEIIVNHHVRIQGVTRSKSKNDKNLKNHYHQKEVEVKS